MGKGGVTKLTTGVLKEILVKGAEWAVENGYGTSEDLKATEEEGRMKEADASGCLDEGLRTRSSPARDAGIGESLSRDPESRSALRSPNSARFRRRGEGQILVMIHCGSRGLGHQVASDYIQSMEDAFGIKDLPDRELIHAPIRSPMGRRYYRAMCAAVNYAFANRQMIAHWVRDVFKKVLGSSRGMAQIYDVCHNVAKIENAHRRGPGEGALRPPQGRDPQLRSRPERAPRGLSGRRPAGHHPREHGHGFLCAGGDGRSRRP